MDIVSHPLQREYDLLYKELDDLYRDIALRFGLSNAAYSVLYALWDLGDGCLQRDICGRCYLSKQTVHSAVRKLESDGLLRMEPGRRRDVHLYLTESGRELVRRTILPTIQAENRAMEAMAPTDREALLRLTAQYVSLLKEQTRALR